MNHKSTFVRILRYLLGLILLIFGLNGFLQFLPMPEMPQSANAFFGALYQTGYMTPLLYGAELIIAMLLLVNRFVPLALLLFAPIALNILLFHIFLAPAGGAAGYITFLLEALLLVAYKPWYQSILKGKTG